MKYYSLKKKKKNEKYSCLYQVITPNAQCCVLRIGKLSVSDDLVIEDAVSDALSLLPNSKCIKIEAKKKKICYLIFSAVVSICPSTFWII